MENNRIDDHWTEAEWKLFQQGYKKKRCIKCHIEYSVEKNYKCPKCGDKVGRYIKDEEVK